MPHPANPSKAVQKNPNKAVQKQNREVQKASKSKKSSSPKKSSSKATKDQAKSPAGQKTQKRKMIPFHERIDQEKKDRAMQRKLQSKLDRIRRGDRQEL